MKNFNKNVKGVTLVSLITTIIVLIILSSIAIYSGNDIIKSSKFTKFTTEMKIIQTHVNTLYEKYRNNETVKIGDESYTGESILTIGKEVSTVQTQADIVFTSDASGITEQAGYRYFDQQTIKDLNIEGIEEEFFINIKKRSVVSYSGFKYEGVTYYTLEQLPDGLYNVEHEDKNTGKPTFNANAKEIGKNKWKINISDIEYSGYIEKWKVNYKLEGQDYWNTSKEYSFIVKESGEYIIQLVNGTITSEERLKVGENTNISSILPSEYQQVEYIESTGTQYIDTGIKLNQKSIAEIEIQITDSGSHNIFGSRTSATEDSFQAIMSDQYNWFAVDFQNHEINRLNITPNFDRNIIRISNKEMKIGDSTQQISSYSDFETPDNAYIFNISGNYADGYTIAKMKLYSCKIWKKDVLVRDFIPCYKKDTGEIGLYDTVEGKFYTNQGTGTFEKGADVIKLPSEYQQVEYIETTGTQWINTNILARSNFQVETEIEVTNEEQDTTVFGYYNENTSFTSNGNYYHLTPYNSKWYFGQNGKEGNAGDYENEIGTRYSIVFNNADGAIIINDEILYTNGIYETADDSKIAISKRGPKQNHREGRFRYFYFKVFDKDKNRYVRNLIPCYQKSDGVIGMYETVEGKFYTNQGTGTFEKGADVN